MVSWLLPAKMGRGHTEVTKKYHRSGRIFPVVLVHFLSIFMCVSPNQPARFRTCNDSSIIVMSVDHVKHLFGLFTTQCKESRYPR